MTLRDNIKNIIDEISDLKKDLETKRYELKEIYDEIFDCADELSRNNDFNLGLEFLYDALEKIDSGLDFIECAMDNEDGIRQYVDHKEI